MSSTKLLGFLGLVGLLAATTPVLGGSHTWRVNELFSNADGTIQFIEIKECCGSPGEIFLAGHNITSASTGSVFTIPANVVAPTSNKHLLFATAGFAALPGAPTPDYIIGDNFLSLTADTITYVPYNAMVYPSPALPLDGISSLNDIPTGAVVGANSPTNYAGATGSIDASGPPVVSVSFALSGSTTPELAGSHDIEVRLDTTAATTEEVSVDIVDQILGSADALDYDAVASQTVVFPIGSVDGATIPVVVDIFDDTLAEGDETFELAIDAVTGAGATIGAPAAHLATIDDSEQATVSFELGAGSASESAGVQSVVVRLSVTGNAGLPTTAAEVNATVADTTSGTASSGVDYATFGPSSVTFPIGSGDGATLSVPLTLLDDPDSEGNESVNLEVASVVGSGASIGSVVIHVFTIVDDEPPPPVANFIRADANQDGAVNIADAIRILDALFAAQPTTCLLSEDANDDNLSNIADPIFVLGYLFSSGPQPLPPFAACSADPTPGALTCVSHTFCP